MLQERAAEVLVAAKAWRSCAASQVAHHQGTERPDVVSCLPAAVIYGRHADHFTLHPVTMAADVLQRLANAVASNRIVVSRGFGIAFFLVVLMMEGLHEGTILSTILFLIGLVLVAIATVGRLWCSLYISGYKDSQLITTGPYSICRNPLYFFSFLGFTGIGFATETFTLGLALSLIFLIAYPPVVNHEEDVLRSRFGPEFDRYCAQTPRFFPNVAKFNEPDTYLVNPKLFRRTMGDVIWFVWFVGIIELVEALHELHYFEPIIWLP